MLFLPAHLFYFPSVLEDENCDRFMAIGSQQSERKSCSYAVILYTAFSTKAKMALSWVALLKTGLFALIMSPTAVGPSKVKCFVKQY